MSELTIKINGKEYQAKLSLEALERIEAQFDNMSLSQVIVQKQGFRVGKAILMACIMGSMPSLTSASIGSAIDAHAEAEGIDSVWEFVKPLIDASGFFGKKKAKDGLLGKT